MAVILNIETSTTVCSTALTADGMIMTHYEDYNGRNHAALLSGYIKSCLDYLAEKELSLDAVAVSIGPGSYTGLRIGLSEAKGLAYALDIPLIAISTLELLATRVMFSSMDIDPETIFVPMIDARRMEVYTAAYDFGLEELIKPCALILDENSYAEILSSDRPVLMFGDGSAKAADVIKSPSVKFLESVEPLAVDMIALAERAYARKEFSDVAYVVPAYLKDFVATKSKQMITNIKTDNK